MALLAAFAGCSTENEDIQTTLPTTIPSSTTSPIVNPYSMYDEMMAVFTAYCKECDDEQNIENFIFKHETGCYIITGNQKVYSFFSEGATDSNKVFDSGAYTLHSVASLGDVMINAMVNAWNAYSTQCAQDHISMYDRQIYLFTCDYFYGTFGLSSDNRLVQNLVLQGSQCGKFGAFTIYLPDNADQSTPGTMSDGELMTIIKNVYDRFSAQVELDSNTAQPMEYYIFEFGGEYYRVDQDLIRLDETAISEAAMDIKFDGWTVFLPKDAGSVPTFNELNDVYTALISKLEEDNVTYKNVADYIYFDGENYYAIDRWNNVTEVTSKKAGKAAHSSEFNGYMVYKKK